MEKQGIRLILYGFFKNCDNSFGKLLCYLYICTVRNIKTNRYEKVYYNKFDIVRCDVCVCADRCKCLYL